MASRPQARPLSPHLGIWRWGPHMLVSILHRATGVGMAMVGVPLFTWWLAATAAGGEAYATFRDVFTTDEGNLNIIGWVVGVGLSLAFFEHMTTGVRHLVLDMGAGYELKRNKLGALACMGVAVALTALFWLAMVLR
ncbi:succinate dehydrogenase, cytochrome b556 subunit [uncultured Sphingomonas sp.]|uniref:succinate dehydrogenase, cytochrome b556 subunit n=1 Tax=uncultured Sphingomonas sp. TaxID=158754 RepID=UPI0035CC4B02